MPAALVGVASCGRCGAATLPKQSHCLDCGMTLLDASPASVLGGYTGVLAGLSPLSPSARRRPQIADLALVALPLVAGVVLLLADRSGLGVALLLLGVAVLVADAVLLFARGRSLARFALRLRTVDDLTATPVRGGRALLGAALLGYSRGTLTADLRRGRDPLASALPALAPDDLGADAARPARRRRLEPAPVASSRRTASSASVVLLLDTGGRLEVTGGVLIGRTPQNPEGAEHTRYAWPDLSRTLSKTHALLEWNGATLWVTDLNSTNGTRLVEPDGREHPLVPGLPGAAAPGWTVRLGDRSFVVRAGTVNES